MLDLLTNDVSFLKSSFALTGQLINFTMAFPTDVLYGIIGGSGVYKMEFLQNIVEYDMESPYGSPSDKVAVADFDGIKCAFLPRHGRHHTFTPTEVNYRANIYVFKQLGVKYLLSVTAVGSLQPHLRPGDLVLCSQFIDKTVHRKSTFFGEGCVAHLPMGLPYDPKLRQIAFEAVQAVLPDVKVHNGGCTVTMEGPAFSTKAESLANKQMGGDVIGMTTATETKLAREAEMAHVVVSMVTDMDAWSDEPHVTVETVIKTLTQNGKNSQIFTRAILNAISKAEGTFECEAHTALKFGVMTPKEMIPKETYNRLELFIGKWMK